MGTGYAYDFKGHGVFTPEGKQEGIEDVGKHNAELEARELAEWAGKPGRFACYVEIAKDYGPGMMNPRGKATTWLGTVLGDVVRVSEYRNNFGARLRHIVMRGTNGGVYHGTYGIDGGNFCRLRLMK